MVRQIGLLVPFGIGVYWLRAIPVKGRKMAIIRPNLFMPLGPSGVNRAMRLRSQMASCCCLLAEVLKTTADARKFSPSMITSLFRVRLGLGALRS